MARKIFVDASGLYALADRRDSSHVQAKERVGKLVESGTGLVLTDYIVDEACTLAKVRAGSDAALRLLEIVERSRAIEMLWIGIEQFEAAKAFFRRQSSVEAKPHSCLIRVIRLPRLWIRFIRGENGRSNCPRCVPISTS